jgi:hypothetical protein
MAGIPRAYGQHFTGIAPEDFLLAVPVFSYATLDEVLFSHDDLLE